MLHFLNALCLSYVFIEPPKTPKGHPSLSLLFLGGYFKPVRYLRIYESCIFLGNLDFHSSTSTAGLAVILIRDNWSRRLIIPRSKISQLEFFFQFFSC